MVSIRLSIKLSSLYKVTLSDPESCNATWIEKYNNNQDFDNNQDYIIIIVFLDLSLSLGIPHVSSKSLKVMTIHLHKPLANK